jgi:DNA-binding MarR family transcriptional regulator
MADRSGQPDPIAAWRSMLLAHSRALRAIEADLEAAGTIALTWYDVLLELRGAGGRLRMQDLGDRVVLSRTRVSRLVDELERRELVVREPDDTDGRVTYATITAEGKKVLRSTAPVYRRGIEEHFTKHLTAAEQQIVATALSRVVDAHQPTAEPRRK